MRHSKALLLLAAVVVAGALMFAAGSRPDPRQAVRSELPSLMPPNANLYLGFADLSTDLERLGSSGLWGEFESGLNHEEFIRSRLWLRFTDRLTQLERLVGAPLDGPTLSRLAASTCALAFYDIGEIEFVYVARAGLETGLLEVLGELEGEFEERDHAGETYHLATDEMLGLEFCWAKAGGYLVISDRERLLLTTLERIGDVGPSLADDPTFIRIVQGLPSDGDQFAYLNLANLRDDGYFKTYWMQKDRTVLERHDAFGATVTWAPDQVTEHRLLARDIPGAAQLEIAPDPMEALQLLPADALVVKTVAAADPAEAASVFLDGGRGGQPVDGFRTPLHDLLEEGALTRDEFDLLVGDRFTVGVLSRTYDATFTLLDRVVVTRPGSGPAVQQALAKVRDRLPANVTQRLAGDVERPFPLESVQVTGGQMWTFDLVTGGLYAPTIATRDGWLIMASNTEAAQAVLDTMDGGPSVAQLPRATELVQASGEGSVRQALYLDLERTRDTYNQVIDAMEQGDTFSSWSAREFWGERVPDLLEVLGSVEGVTSWSSETSEGLRGETRYQLFDR